MGAHGACILVLFHSCAHSRFLDACHAVFLIVLLFDILHHLFRFRCLHVDDPATLVDVTLFDALVATFVFIAWLHTGQQTPVRAQMSYFSVLFHCRCLCSRRCCCPRCLYSPVCDFYEIINQLKNDSQRPFFLTEGTAPWDIFGVMSRHVVGIKLTHYSWKLCAMGCIIVQRAGPKDQ